MVRRTRRHRSHKRSTTLYRRRYGKGRKSGRKCRKTRRMRGGLDAGTILRQCVVVKKSKAPQIIKLAADNKILLTSVSDNANPCQVIVPQLIQKNVINELNANTFFSSL